MNHILKRPFYIAVSAILLLVLFSASAFAVTASYTYDELNRLTQVSYDNGNHIKYTYDAAGNISKVDCLSSTDKSSLYVVNGSGSGEYGSGSIVNITANLPVTGKIFDRWTGDVTQVDNIYLANTFITMPDSNVTVYATYKDKPQDQFYLSVSSGSGSGEYEAGQMVSIAATPAPDGQVFDFWSGDVSSVANIYLAQTSLIMPDSNISIQATYENVVSQTVFLDVQNGNGSGEYTPGSVVAITADTPPSGQVFDRWVGDVSRVANVNLASTTVTLADVDVMVIATYKDQTSTLFSLAVEGGSGDGSYLPGTVVTINAGSAPYGMTFDKWTGQTTTVADINQSETEITMPNSDVSVTASYKNADGIVYVDVDGDSSCYPTIMKGYSACSNWGLIMVKSDYYLEDLLFNQNKTTRLSCGWDSTFSENSTTSTVTGCLTISAGTVEVENLVISDSSSGITCDLCKACMDWQYGMSLIRESCTTLGIYKPVFDYKQGSDQGGYNTGHNVGGVLMMLADCENVDQLTLSEPYAIELAIVEPADGVYFMDVNFSLLNLPNSVTCGDLNGSFSSMIIESFADPALSGGTQYCVNFSNTATCFQYHPVAAGQTLYNPGFWFKDFCSESISEENKVKVVRTCFSPFLEAGKPLLLIDMPTFFYDPNLISSGTTVKVKISLVGRDCELESCVHEMCSCIETVGVFE